MSTHPPALHFPSVAQRRAAIAARNPVWAAKALHHHLQDATARWPDRPLVITNDVYWSYGEVTRRCEAFARGFHQLGLRAGDRVALILANYPEFAPIVYAIWRLGASVIPVNCNLKGNELVYVLEQSRARMLITMSEFRNNRYAEELDRAAPGWTEARSEQLPELQTVILHGEHRHEVLHVEDVPSLAPAGPLPADVARAEDPAIIMYTSGTTGLPKGVIQTHDGLARAAYSGAYHQAAEEGRRTVFSLPFFHGFGLVLGLLEAPFVGGAVIPLLNFDVKVLLSAIERHRATYLMLVPTMSIALIEHPELGRYDLSSLRSVISGSAPSPIHVWQCLKERLGVDELFTAYGMTELSSAVTRTRPEDSIETLCTTVGSPMLAGVAAGEQTHDRLVQYKTIDPRTLADLPLGTEGELCARGPTATPGYFEKAQETRELLLPGGWVRSGDLGRIMDDGYLELTGRSKELYKSGAELVAPREVEEVLSAYAEVSQVYVVGLPDERWGEIGCAWIVWAPGASKDASGLIDHARRHLAGFKLPKRVFFIDAVDLPLTATGKVQKFRLAQMAIEAMRRAPDAGQIASLAQGARRLAPALTRPGAEC